ncbi:hypothetical protein J7K27_06335 [Candidatus Bathyarchaeota archaeon]|nr:hypothetical protein [Candidatus Bathyarchaeota archaeon]
MTGLFAFLLLASIYPAKCQNQVEYNVTLYEDGSALWVIRQVLDINATYDDLYSFQKRISTLIDETQNLTNRKMAVGLELSVTMHSFETYKKVEYQFLWINFSQKIDNKLVIGDVFKLSNFFDRLYGNGSLYLTYPAEYELQEVSPECDEQYASLHIIRWISTLSFQKGDPNIVLVPASQQKKGWSENPVVYVIIGAAIAALSFFAYFKKVRFKRKYEKEREREHIIPRQPETDEEKILRLLRMAGGRMAQRSLVEQSGFSKAKISQILATLEAKGVISRVKKGRSKIVILEEQN